MTPTTPPPGAEGQTDELKTLLTAACNASFDCGEHDSDADEDPGVPSYRELSEIATAKREAVIKFFRAALAAGAPVQREIDSLKYELGEAERAVQYWKAKAGAPVQSQPVGNVTWGTRGHTFHWYEEIPTSGKTELYAAAPLQVSGATDEQKPSDPHWYDSPQSSMGGKTARELYAANPAYSHLAAPAGAVVTPDLSMLGVPLPHEVRGILEKYPRTKFVLLADVEALFAAPTPTTGEPK